MRKTGFIISCVLSVLFALTSTSCANGEAEKLRMVEELSDVDNDSAVSILENIDTLRLDKSRRALYHLLRLRFHYLSGNNPALPDSMPAWAEREILNDGDPDNVFEIHFWKISHHSGHHNLISAMLEAEMSRLLLQETTHNKTDKTVLEAHIDKIEGEIWSVAGDANLAISHMQKADIGYSEAKAHDYIVSNQSNKINLAEILYDKGFYTEAIELLDSVKPINKKMQLEAKFHKLAPLIRLQRFEDVRRITQELQKEDEVIRIALLPAMAEVALADGDVALAKRYVAEFLEPRIYNLQIFYLQRKIAEKEGDFAKALEWQKTISELEGNGYSGVSTAELSQALDRQNEMLMEENRDKARKQRKTLITIIILSAFALIAGASAALWIIRKRKARMDELVMEIEELRNRDSERGARIGGLLAQRFESMNRLCDEYFNLNDIKDENLARNEIYKTLSAQLKEMGGESFRKKLEESLNENMDGLMTRFREAFPGDNESAILFLYFSSGFSAKAVGIFTKLKKSSVYSRRRRLREKIEQSSTPYRDEFLSMLS